MKHYSHNYMRQHHCAIHRIEKRNEAPPDGDMMRKTASSLMCSLRSHEAMFAKKHLRSNFIRAANTIGAASIICRRQTSLKKDDCL